MEQRRLEQQTLGTKTLGTEYARNRDVQEQTPAGTENDMVYSFRDLGFGERAEYHLGIRI